MSRFLEDAQQILEAAERGSGSDLAILIQGRGIRLITGKSDWPLDSLMTESGASIAYRVHRSGGQVRVEGRSGTETCVLGRRPAVAAARELLTDRRDYEIIGRVQCGSAAKILLT